MPVNKKVNTVWAILFLGLCIAGFISSYSTYKPGFMSPDSIDQYGQALTGKYSDWHPVAMAFVWHIMLKLHNGPQLMLILQLTLFWSACFLIAKRIKGFVGLIVIACFAFLPFFQNFLGYIIKDVQMGLSWLLAIAILMQQVTSGSRLNTFERTFSFLLIIYGALLRFDALPGFLLLIGLWIMVVCYNKSRKTQLLIGILSLLFLLFTNWSIDKITHPAKLYSERKLFMHDLSGIYVATSENVFPEILFERIPDFDTAYIRLHCHPATYDMLWWNNDGIVMEPPAEKIVNTALRNAWWQAISQHPIIYLQNRYEGFLYHLRIKKRTEFIGVYHPWIDNNKYGIVLNQTEDHIQFVEWMEQNKAKIFMKPWFWLLTNTLLLLPVFMINDRRYRYAIILLLLSSLLYRLPQFFIFQSDIDFRYFYWTCLICTVSFFWIVKGLYLNWQKNQANSVPYTFNSL